MYGEGGGERVGGGAVPTQCLHTAIDETHPNGAHFFLETLVLLTSHVWP